MIFTSVRTHADENGYAAASRHMAALAAAQPGYAGMESARSPDGTGITISFWDSADDAAAWRDHPDHIRIREAGRERWYDSYTVTIATVTRDYCWTKTESHRPAID